MRLGNLRDFLQQWQPGGRILIAGSGPSLGELGRIDLGQYTTITVNGACQAFSSDVYMAMNPVLPDYDWWLPTDCAKHYLVSEELSCETPAPHYVFQRVSLRRAMCGGQDEATALRTMTADCVCSWGTVVGTLLLILALEPGRKVDLVGCDFENMIYVHGVPHDSLLYDTHGLPDTHRNNDEQELTEITTVLDFVQRERNMVLRHYGPTKLPVEMI
jgi:hypothetical protein